MEATQIRFIYKWVFLRFSFCVWLSVCLSNKCHLLMSFPSFFFLFCLCACVSVCQTKVIYSLVFLRFSFFVCLPRGGVLPYLGSMGMCRPKAPHFSAWSAPKDSTFSTWTAPKDPPFQKYTFVCSTLPTWADPKDPPFKNIRFFVSFSSKTPSIFSEGSLWTAPPPFFCVGPLPKPPIFKLWAAHTHTYIYI